MRQRNQLQKAVNDLREVKHRLLYVADELSGFALLSREVEQHRRALDVIRCEAETKLREIEDA